MNSKPRSNLNLAILLTCVILLATAPLFSIRTSFTAHAATDLVIYQDTLASGWEDWSWETTRNLANTTPVYAGSQSISVQYDGAYKGFSLRAPTVIDSSGYSAIEFWIYGATGATQITFYTQSSDGSGASATVAINAPAATWTKVNVTLAALGNPTAIARLNWQDASGAAPPTYYLDDITLVGAIGGGATFPDTTADRQFDFSKSLAGVAIAPSGRLYVSSWRESKIYSWPTAKSAANPTSSADLILGVAMDPESGAGNGAGCGAVTDQSFCGPESLAVDTNGNLYVAATYQNRVQIFLNPETDADPNEADLSISGLSGPRGLALDSAGNLYVVNEFASGTIKKGIHIFEQPLTTNTVVDRVIEDAISFPLGVAVDGVGNVYVGDAGAHNVKRYNTPLSTNLLVDQTYTGFADPHDLAIDANGNLYISDVVDYDHSQLPNPPDSNNSRVAVIADPLNSTTIAHQFPDLAYPLGLAFDDAGSLYVAHCVGPYKCDGAGKLLVFDAPVATPTPTVPTATPTIPTATPGDTATPQTPTGGEINLTVDVAADRHTISDLIYGMNWGSETLADDADISVRRWGGNRSTRYNWKTDMGNAALDWYFENGRESDAINLPDDSAANRFIQQDRRTNTDSYITVPMAGYVSSANEAACGFSTNNYVYTPTQFPNGVAATDGQWRPHCGNGVTQFKNNNQFQPVFFQGNDPLDTSIVISEAFVGEWVNFLTGKFGTAQNGGVRFYGLDNEPELWNSSHADIHPAGYSYDELGDLSLAYASAIKRADPSAQILGPEFGGWWGYFTSTKDVVAGNQNDRLAHGNLEVTAWYLQQLAAYEQQHGTRLLDTLSIHIYPQADGIALGTAGDAATQALRLRSVRALWDTAYQDESWIKDAGPDGGIVKLIPRMRAWVDNHYPGTKLAISEYNWGGLEHINGALAQADILGILGRERVDLATIWAPPAPEQPGAYAFRIYRNYDGQGAKFGDIGVQANSNDPNKLAIYAAQRSSDGSLTLVVINKTGSAINANLAIANLQSPAVAEVYRYSSADLSTIARQADQPMVGTGFTASYPANSITLVRIAASSGSTPVATPISSSTAVLGSTPTNTPILSTATHTPVAGATATPVTPNTRRVLLPIIVK